MTYVKKLLSYLAVAAIMISAATGFSSCAKDGEDGKDGKDGVEGKDGEDGKDGVTPFINEETGTWWIGTTNTGIPAAGITPEIKEGFWWIGDVNTGIPATGPEGPTNTFVVTFDYDDGTTVTQTVLGGAWAMPPPPAPTIVLKAGLYEGTVPENVPAFGWFEEGKEEPFNFYAPITGNISLKQTATTPSPIADVAANDVTEAVNYANANPGEYTLLIGADVNAGTQSLSDNVKLSIIGIGEERTIQYSGADNARLFTIGGALTLGQNITLRGIATGSTYLVGVSSNSSLTMLAGSKITGHTTSGSFGEFGTAVQILGGNSVFTMQGGEITGNHTSNTSSADVSGGVFAALGATFTMTGGSITGNTRGTATPPEAMDVVLILEGAAAVANATKTGGVIGVSIPAEFAGN